MTIALAESLIWGARVIQHEIMLFAAIGIAIGALDDFVVDGMFLARRIWRWAFVYTRYPRMTGETLPPSPHPGILAVFIPAWDESDVIGMMVRGCLTQWPSHRYRLFVGVYPNDPATMSILSPLEAADDRVIRVTVAHDGPTTKGDCLNALWQAMCRYERVHDMRFKAVVLHDAEDVVHADELALFDFMIDRFDMVQIPVLPLVNQQSRWIAGHYLDEFAEAHGKLLSVREAVGAALPSAGVGCAFSRTLLGKLADRRHGLPFDADCLTEDYELGLHLAALGGRGVFVRMRDQHGRIISTREYFPDTFSV